MAREQEPDATEDPSVWGCLRTVVLVFLVFVLLVVGALIYIGLRSESLTEELPATLHVANGRAEMRGNGGTAWTPTSDLLPLAPGDAIRVHEGSGIVLFFFDGSRIYLEPGSQLSLQTSVRTLNLPPLLSPILTQLFPDYPAPLDARPRATVVATLQAGAATVYSSQPPSPGSYFRVDTPNSTIQGEATIYSVAIEAEGTAVVDDLSGTALVAALAQFRDESHGIAVSFLQPGHSMRVPPLPAESATSEMALRQRGAAREVLGITASSGILPVRVEGLVTEPAAEAGTIMAYRLIPSPTPTVMPAKGSNPRDDMMLPHAQSGSDVVLQNDEQSTDMLPAGLVVTLIDNVSDRLAGAQQLLQPKELTISRFSERDLGARLPGGVSLRIQGGGVISTYVQGFAYTVTVGANKGELTMGGLPPGVSAPILPAKIVSATSETGQLTIVYKDVHQ